MNIIQMLRGATPEADQRLLELKDRIGVNPLTSWYPSAGNDYRDLIELSAPKADASVIRELPDLFVHTDCIPDCLNLGPIPFEDKRNYKVKNDKILSTGWNPKYKLIDGINEVYSLFRDNRIKNNNDPIFHNGNYIRKEYGTKNN